MSFCCIVIMFKGFLDGAAIPEWGLKYHPISHFEKNVATGVIGPCYFTLEWCNIQTPHPTYELVTMSCFIKLNIWPPKEKVIYQNDLLYDFKASLWYAFTNLLSCKFLPQYLNLLSFQLLEQRSDLTGAKIKWNKESIFKLQQRSSWVSSLTSQVRYNKVAVVTHLLLNNYRANLVAGWEAADETSLTTQHGNGTIIWSLQLGPDGLTDCGHVRLQHDREENRHIHRHASYGACTFPTTHTLCCQRQNYFTEWAKSVY